MQTIPDSTETLSTIEVSERDFKADMSYYFGLASYDCEVIVRDEDGHLVLVAGGPYDL